MVDTWDQRGAKDKSESENDFIWSSLNCGCFRNEKYQQITLSVWYQCDFLRKGGGVEALSNVSKVAITKLYKSNTLTQVEVQALRLVLCTDNPSNIQLLKMLGKQYDSCTGMFRTGHRERPLFTLCCFLTQHNTTDVTTWERALSWHAGCRNVHPSCCLWTE